MEDITNYDSFGIYDHHPILNFSMFLLLSLLWGLLSLQCLYVVHSSWFNGRRWIWHDLVRNVLHDFFFSMCDVINASLSLWERGYMGFNIMSPGNGQTVAMYCILLCIRIRKFCALTTGICDFTPGWGDCLELKIEHHDVQHVIPLGKWYHFVI